MLSLNYIKEKNKYSIKDYNNKTTKRCSNNIMNVKSKYKDKNNCKKSEIKKEW